ncbi:MAG: hypothetical protein IPJ75_18870 [Ignavibacteriales bacterium]|nr:hypothetical protein [Ignavibacteriales bacterium]
MTLYKTTFCTLVLLFFTLSNIIQAQNVENKEIWKELSKNKFNTVYYDLTSLIEAKSSKFDQQVKTEYNSEQKMPGINDKYFTEIILYSVNFDEGKYFIKKATYLNRKKQEIKVFDYTSNGKIDTKQMMPITKGSPIFDIFLLHKTLHGKG